MQTKPPLRGTTLRCLEAIVRRLQARKDEAQQELLVAEAALSAAMKREDEMKPAKHNHDLCVDQTCTDPKPR